VRQRVLVTGVNGFVGHHAVRELADHGYDVVGLARERSGSPDLPLHSFLSADLTEPWPEVEDVDAVVHLAGLSAVGPSFDDPQTYVDVNSSIINRMASWAVSHAPTARAVIVSTGAVYDSQHLGDLDESAPTSFTSPYVVSKVLVENLSAYYRRRGLDWVVARPFNHIGPGQGPGFLLPDLAAQVEMAARTGGPAIQVGDLSTARDYTDVRDVARAYRMLLEASIDDDDWVFNVCSGRSRTGTELFEALTGAMGVAHPEVQVDPRRMRPDDPRVVRGSALKLQRLTGWQPSIDFTSSVADFVATRTAAVEH